jgi:predicted pyridoxine 5'-phosphate oxidase superfamily flavin-nucleotide-binding protein
LSTWEIKESGVPQGTIPEPLLFIMYIHDPPYGINSYAKLVIYSDDTTMLIIVNNLNNLKTKLNSTLNNMNTCVLVNGLSLNIEMTHSVKFIPNHLQNDQFQISYQNKTKNKATIRIRQIYELEEPYLNKTAKFEQCMLCSEINVYIIPAV